MITKRRLTNQNLKELLTLLFFKYESCTNYIQNSNAYLTGNKVFLHFKRQMVKIVYGNYSLTLILLMWRIG